MRADRCSLARAYFAALRDLGEVELPLERAEPKPRARAAALEEVASEIARCQACRLASVRTRTVPGMGNPETGLVLVGEAPGEQEDHQGKPFVGPSGQLLRRLMALAGMGEEWYYIVNVLKCRPPGNRDPWPDEIQACAPHLWRQLEILQPRLIVCLGRFAAGQILGVNNPSIGRLRRAVHGWGDASVVVTYHPSALLHRPEYRAEAWRDIKQVGRLARELGILPGSVP